MDSRNAEETPTTSRRELIGQRLRIGSVVLAMALALYGVLDVTTRPGGILPVIWIYVAQLALVVLVQVASRDPRVRTTPLAAGAVILWNALFCSYAALSANELHALVAPSVVIVMAAALLLPWGVWPQLVVGAVCTLTYLGAVVLSGHPADIGTLYALLSLGAAAAVGCVGAYVVEQRAVLIEEQTERLRDMNRLMREAGVKKDEFLASVSHELRTPVNVVLGYIDLLLDHSFGPLEPAQRDVLHRITKNASNLSHLINDLIDLSRIEAGRLRVELAPIELASLFADLAGVMEVLLVGHEVKFSATIAAGCDRVHADPDRLKQIVSNLLVNAVKFTERGSVTLAAALAGDGAVAISVADTGIGIPPAAHRAIFEPFRQVHDRSRRTPGAGIGLSISSRLAQLMGGSLVVESTPGEGSRFTLTVPVATGDAVSSEPLRRVS